jgi:hypothetical protein
MSSWGVAAKIYQAHAALKTGKEDDAELDEAKFQGMQEEMVRIYIQNFNDEATAMWELMKSHISASLPNVVKASGN